MHSLKLLIFRGGLTPSLRKEAWKYLLGVHDWKKSDAENTAVSFFGNSNGAFAIAVSLSVV